MKAEYDLSAEFRRQVESLTLREAVAWIEVQMEWVRSECEEYVGGAAEDTLERIGKFKLTVAPEGWAAK